ncbi:MAG: putative small protein [Verrucomicrobiota bacterium]|jgi:hypothetical protein
MISMSENSITPTKTVNDDEEWLNVVKKKVKQLQYGSIQITVHDGRVTQVESVEKTRIVQRAKDS